MAEGVRLELTSAILETAVLTFERTLNVHGSSNGIRTHTGRILNPLSLPIGLRSHKGVLGTGRHPWICYALSTYFNNSQTSLLTRFMFL